MTFGVHNQIMYGETLSFEHALHIRGWLWLRSFDPFSWNVWFLSLQPRVSCLQNLKVPGETTEKAAFEVFQLLLDVDWSGGELIKQWHDWWDRNGR